MSVQLTGHVPIVNLLPVFNILEKMENREIAFSVIRAINNKNIVIFLRKLVHVSKNVSQHFYDLRSVHVFGFWKVKIREFNLNSFLGVAFHQMCRTCHAAREDNARISQHTSLYVLAI